MRSDKSSKTKKSSKRKRAGVSDNWCNNNSNLQSTEPGIEQVSENEFSGKKASEEIVDSEIREINSSKDTSLSVKSIFNIDELTVDDEIYTLQCPENYIKQNLCNRSLDLTKHKQSITSNNELFLVELLNYEKKFITLAVPKKTSGGSLIKMPLKGHIVIQKVIEIPPNKTEGNNNDNVNDGDDDACDRYKIVFPNDIKVRHPLLGVEWKAHIDLANEAISKNCFLGKSNKIKSKYPNIKEKERKSLKRENSDSHIIAHKKKKKKIFDA